jgi:hypothetical protein
MNLMGRAKTLWSHCRDMRVDVSKGLIKYTIPRGNEILGDFVKAEKQGSHVVIYYTNVPDVQETKDHSSTPRGPPGSTEKDPFKVVF